MPRKRAFQKINEYVDDAFDVIPTTLFDAQVVIYRSVSRSSSQAFVVFIGDVTAIFLDEFLGQSEVNNINLRTFLIRPHQKVLGLDIPVYKFLAVHVLKPIDNLNADHNDSFQIESFSRFLKQLLERGTQQLLHHNVIVGIFAEVVKCRESLYFLLVSI